jgi:hypothetical protein
MARAIMLATLPLLLTLSAALAQELSPLARSIASDLDRLESRPVTPDIELESDRIQRTPRERGRAARLFSPTELRSAQEIARGSDLGAAQQDLRTLKTRDPDDPAIPLLERQLDRIGRGGTTLYQPSRDPAALYRR